MNFKGIGSRILEMIPGTKAHNEAGIKKSLEKIELGEHVSKLFKDAEQGKINVGYYKIKWD